MRLARFAWPAAIGVLSALILAVSAAALSDTDPTVRLLVAQDEHGDPALGPHRLRITQDGHPTAIYWVQLHVNPGQELRVRADLQVTRCRDTDYNPPDGKTSGCQGTHVYDYSPDVKMKFFLSKPQPDAPAKPQLDGDKIGDTVDLTCTKDKHHCVPVNIEAANVNQIDPTLPAGGADRFVTVVVEASNPNAKRCDASDPSTCDVMDLEDNHGRLNVVKVTQPGQVDSGDWEDAGERADRLHVITDTSGGQVDNYSRVVYSVKLNPTNTVGSTAGDIIEVRGNLLTHSGLPYPTPPLVASYFVLANDPDKINGRNISERNGENCDGDCNYLKQAATEIDCDDVRNGRRFVNLVALAERTTAYASTSDTVNIRDGGSIRVNRYDARYNPNPPTC